MSLESFIGMDSGEGMSESSLEQLRERMKAAAAQIAAIRKEEKKQKQKEDDLLKILLKFIQHSHKSELVLLISRALEQNIPAGFVLAIVLLGNLEIQHHMQTLLAPKEAHPDQKALIFFNQQDQSLPLKIRIELDNWIKNILESADATPHKLLKYAYKIEKIEIESSSHFEEAEYKEEKVIKDAIVQLGAFVIRDFLMQNNLDEPLPKLQEFARFILNGILEKTQENLDNRVTLTGESSDII
ncbi:hypothetical protein COU74_03050 [Candidatus Peregrinibacteria bacterium CG10_big_fil_rev_8_21_14_0_10_36_19]|nr:MAG: hypothetical protein COU74_03050 [Candidatus Peregrinibacteria bacterium CG10_big_fil_rev_8_21_14_0_10_36_19]